MKKERRVCKNYEFSSIIQNRQFVKSTSFVCYYQKKKEEHARVGISVGKKLGNAVHRNLVKRQVRSMIDSIYNFEEDYDTIIIVRPPYIKKNYQENFEELKKDKTRIEKKIG
ncbi:MAG: ribonuclease P protein component [Firmicutes bacterium]|nr:ribonuclease P protein component [Bacillota bacterium]